MLYVLFTKFGINRLQNEKQPRTRYNSFFVVGTGSAFINATRLSSK